MSLACVITSPFFGGSTINALPGLPAFSSFGTTVKDKFSRQWADQVVCFAFDVVEPRFLSASTSATMSWTCS
jgi:hypothetical protein